MLTEGKRLTEWRPDDTGQRRFCCWRSGSILVPITGKRLCVLDADCVKGLGLYLGMRPLITLRCSKGHTCKLKCWSVRMLAGGLYVLRLRMGHHHRWSGK